jgi:hypothetical protein
VKVLFRATGETSTPKTGYVQVELEAREEDADLLREIAEALADPTRRVRMRAHLRKSVRPLKSEGFKAFLAQAPLAGVDLERSPDTGREIEL